MSPLFKESPELAQPEPEARLWRYMPLDRFAYLLESQALYFRRVDLFDDSFEGSVGRPASAIADHLRQAEASGSVEATLSDQLSIRRQMRKFFYASCWHINEGESVAMWDLYLPRRDGVAIQTTYRRLRQAVAAPSTGRLMSGSVSYLDYEADVLDFLGPVVPMFCKGREYSHEKEFRLIFHVIPQEAYSERALAVLRAAAEGGGSVRVHPSELNLAIAMPEAFSAPIDIAFIETITLAPQSVAKTGAMAAALVKQHLRNVEVRRSRLESEPLF